ncbi:MAG: translation elongation factor Ts [Deltaproteobacteria bacterium]|jgi:elongation factor Ts|nr:translation elongation factor Ts [Deltaproteobacteria bacterium]
MEITAKMVKELREKTNAGMMDCKNALVESQGDLEKAKDWLREHGLATMSKRAGRVAREGVVLTAVSPDGKKGSIVEFNTETDFVAKLDKFKAIALSIAECLTGSEETPKDIPALLEKACPKCGLKYSAILTDNTATTGEKSEIRRFAVLEASEKAFVHAYNHAGNKISTLVVLEVEKPSPEAEEVAHTLAMQIAAGNPLAIQQADLNPADVEREKNIYQELVKKDPTKEKIWPKIVEGLMKKYYQQVVLLDQEFIKEPKISVKTWLEQFRATLGAVTVKNFVRYQLAEELPSDKTENN